MVKLQRGVGIYVGKSIGLRRESGVPFQDFSPQDLQEFTLGRSQRTYRSVEVEIPEPKRQGTPVLTSRFGEVLVDGDVELIKVNLAYNEYPNNAIGSQPCLYLLREGELEFVLELTTIVVYDNLHANPSRFRHKLKYLVRGCEDVFQYARTANFTDGDIMRVISDYAACRDLQDIKINKRRISSKLQLSHFARLSALDIRDKHYSDQQLSLTLGYQGEAAFTNKLRWLGVLFSGEYAYQTFRWEDETNIQQSMVKLNLSLALKPYERENFSLQLTSGLSSYNATSSSFSSFFSNNYFLLSSGVRVRSNNYLFGVSYEYTPNQIKAQPGNILQLSFGYKFAGW